MSSVNSRNHQPLYRPANEYWIRRSVNSKSTRIRYHDPENPLSPEILGELLAVIGVRFKKTYRASNSTYNMRCNSLERAVLEYNEKNPEVQISKETVTIIKAIACGSIITRMV